MGRMLTESGVTGKRRVWEAKRVVTALRLRYSECMRLLSACHLTGSFLIASIAVFAQPATAKQEFAAYEGRDALRTGQGGTRVTKNGIDYWTSGTPPRKFEILGIITDKRKNGLLDGSVVGSKSVAKFAKKVGGNAVIIGPASSQVLGYGGTGSATSIGGTTIMSGHARAITRTTTQIVVIRYLP